MKRIRVVKGQPGVTLSKAEFARRFRQQFQDPAFAAVESELQRVLEAAWSGYSEYRKSPNTRRAGRGFAEPECELPVEWLATRAAIRAAETRRRNARSPSRILLISGSGRHDQTCPGEMPKTYRLVQLAARAIRRARGFEVDLLDLGLLSAEYGRRILPCKACVSTAMPLCHWPCSCYPNHALGQTGDWMNELYPRWAAAHGVMIVCPVNWYQAPSGLKLMIDRLVCADGGNPDPTTTGGKDPVRAKALELAGWDYPKHLAGRACSVVVHGDAAGVDTLRRMLSAWMSDLGLVAAGPSSAVGAYLGYYRPYATSHDDLDADRELQGEVRNAARSLVTMVRLLRTGGYRAPDAGLVAPRQK